MYKLVAESKGSIDPWIQGLTAPTVTVSPWIQPLTCILPLIVQPVYTLVAESKGSIDPWIQELTAPTVTVSPMGSTPSMHFTIYIVQKCTCTINVRL